MDYTVQQHPIWELPPEVLQFLLPSRYCEVDLMVNIAANLFNNTPAAWQRVQAILDWVHGNVTFGYQFLREQPRPLLKFLTSAPASAEISCTWRSHFCAR